MSRALGILRRIDRAAHAALNRHSFTIVNPGDAGFPRFPIDGLRHRGIWVRPYSPDDPDIVTGRLELEVSPGVQLWRPAHMAPMRSIEQVREWCTVQRDAVLAGLPASLAVIDERGGSPTYAGDTNFKLGHPRQLPVVEMGCALLPRSRGGSVAVNAGGLLSTWLLDVAGVRRLELRHSSENRGACLVSLRLGFQREGLLRNAMALRGPDGTVHVDDVCLHAFVDTDARSENWPSRAAGSISMRTSTESAGAP